MCIICNLQSNPIRYHPTEPGSGQAARSSVDLAINNQPTTDTCPDDDNRKALNPLAHTVPILAEGCKLPVMAYPARQTQTIAQYLAERETVQARQVGSRFDRPVTIQHSRHTYPNSQDRIIANGGKVPCHPDDLRQPIIRIRRAPELMFAM
jgi:hypothetical protein